MGTVNKTTDELNQFIEDTEVFMEESPGKKAAATGAEVFNDYSGNKATGQYSHAEGKGVTASGTNSHAEGTQTVAGPYSHAEGNLTDASGDTAHAEGYKTKALGQFSHAEGSDCTCESGAPRSHAEGFNTKTSAPNSHAEGNGSHVLQGGDCGHCEGSGTWVWSFAGHAEGNQTQAWDTAHAEGYLCQAQGTLSHAGGYGSVASGYSSFAHGLAVNTTLDYEVSFGQYNATGPRTAFSIGVGTGEDVRKNALEVSTSGNTYLYGVGGYDGTNADTAVPVNHLDQPSRGDENMNECLQTGFYPWCTLGRPSGATGAFSLAVRRSTTPDYQGYYTVEQTCYGREAELGQVWTRMVFDKGGSASSDTDYMEWVRVDAGGADDVREGLNLLSGRDNPVTVRACVSVFKDKSYVRAWLSRPLASDERIAIFRKTRNKWFGKDEGYKYTQMTKNSFSGVNLQTDPKQTDKADFFHDNKFVRVPGLTELYELSSGPYPSPVSGEDMAMLFLNERKPGEYVITDGRHCKIFADVNKVNKGSLHMAIGVVRMEKGGILLSNLSKFKARYEVTAEGVKVGLSVE